MYRLDKEIATTRAGVTTATELNEAEVENKFLEKQSRIMMKVYAVSLHWRMEKSKAEVEGWCVDLQPELARED